MVAAIAIDARRASRETAPFWRNAIIMSVLVTGSVAIDHIMGFPDRFANHILPDQIHKLSVAFAVPTLDKVWGGTGANISYNLQLLDVDAILLATVGRDLGAYETWMDEHGVRRDWLRVLDDSFTAQCFITTDQDDCQITAFHPGAMDRAHEAPISGLREEFNVGIVSPNGKRAMQEHARELKRRGAVCVIDPGQGLPLFAADELLELIDGASVYVVNEYEWEMTQTLVGQGEDEIAAKVGALVVTLGERGSWVRRGGRDTGVVVESQRSEIAPVEAASVEDPTGCGDAYRAGLLSSLTVGGSVERGAKIGAVMGALKVARAGPQSIVEDLAAIGARFEREFGTPL
jgi:adenosine kinase